MHRYLADLHIHTALSPCASPEMTPPAIVRTAIERGLAMIAVCDHNTTDNAAAVQQSAAGKELAVLAGIEIQTTEEVHVLGIFPDAGNALAVGGQIRQTLPSADEAYYRRFGEQDLMDPAGNVIGSETRMLDASCGFDLGRAIELIHRHGGLAVAAHVDRPSFSVMSQLGEFPADAGFDAIEISAFSCRTPAAREKFGRFGLAVITSSDTHDLSEIGSPCASLLIEQPTFDELQLAFRGAGGREAGVA